MPIMFANRRNSRVMSEFWVEENDGDVRLQTGSRNKAVARMRIEK